ncbi:MAG: hypothetical protein NTW03_08590 [Verrucomicrobia bacterium]|nr:hypothetical protein [Verrucomicrobiota bacterium]
MTLANDFFLDWYQVTQGECLSVIGSNPSDFTGDTNLPVEQVNWGDATNDCAQLTATAPRSRINHVFSPHQAGRRLKHGHYRFHRGRQ